MTVHVTRLPIRLAPDPRRVITRLFVPGEENRVRDIIGRLLAMSQAEVDETLANVQRNFQATHPNIEEVFLKHFDVVRHRVPNLGQITDQRQRLIGACFTMEYAIESAALFNPSIVPAIDQDDLPSGSVRFVMSLRATGEGHISSIVFRRGVVDRDGQVSIEPPGHYSRTLEAIVPDEFEKGELVSALCTLGELSDPIQKVLSLLGDRFTRAQLSDAIDKVRAAAAVSGKAEESIDDLLSLTRANYRLIPPPGAGISELVIFPFSENERHGVEDMRLVRFVGDDGAAEYYGTYTAYNGFRIFPQLLNYRQNGDIRIQMLKGECAKNKGMALFPRRVGGKFAMVARLDNENLYYMTSDEVTVWDAARLLQTPRFPWEVIQIGNCGSPLETTEGWLLLTHGVGPMRQYCIGATLLDLDDPRRVIGQTSEPLLVPADQERFGYVPNVVYSCGGMIHADRLILPYAMSDVATSIAVVSLNELLESLQR